MTRQADTWRGPHLLLTWLHKQGTEGEEQVCSIEKNIKYRESLMGTYNLRDSRGGGGSITRTRGDFFFFTCFIEPYKVFTIWRRMKTWNGSHIFFIFPPPPKCTNSIPYLEFHTLMPNVPRWQTQYKRGNKNRVVKEEKQHQTKADRKPNIQINQKNWFGG